MPRKIPPLFWAVLPLAYLLYFYGLGAVGLLGKDEPRYASVAREMARSGDWVTPRLWGQPWFEKPALSYWMIGAGFRLGLGPDLAPRLPMALLAVAFLGFYWWILRREFGRRAAWMAALILGTCGMWLGYSQVGVTDLPLTATFSAAMLLCLPWVARRDGKFLPAAGAMLGLAALAKGLVPLALAVPLIWWMKKSTAPLLRMIAAFLVVALPWYLLCYWRNGRAFFDDFILKQHFARITSSSLMHVQPWWFYLRWLPGELLPWTPLLLLLAAREAYRDPRRRFLLALALGVAVHLPSRQEQQQRGPGQQFARQPAQIKPPRLHVHQAAGSDAREVLLQNKIVEEGAPIAPVAQQIPGQGHHQKRRDHAQQRRRRFFHPPNQRHRQSQRH